MIAINYLILLALLVIVIFTFFINDGIKKTIEQNDESLKLMKISIDDSKKQYKKIDDIRSINTIKTMLFDEIENIKYDNAKIENVIEYTNYLIKKYNDMLKEQNIDINYDFNYEKYKIISMVNKYNIKEYISNLKIDDETKN